MTCVGVWRNSSLIPPESGSQDRGPAGYPTLARYQAIPALGLAVAMVEITTGVDRPMLDLMGTETSTTRHVFRQRSSVGLAVVCGVVGVVLLVSLALSWSDYARPLSVAWLLFGLAVAWAVFARPAVVLDVGGVTLRNLVRDVHIPWTRLTHTSSRWNLKVFAGDRGYTAWAIASEHERPKGGAGGMFRMPIPGRLQGLASADTRPPATSPKATAQSVARSIDQAKQEYGDAVAQGELPAAPDDTVRITWVPLAMVVLLLPAIAVIVLSLT